MLFSCHNLFVYLAELSRIMQMAISRRPPLAISRLFFPLWTCSAGTKHPGSFFLRPDSEIPIPAWDYYLPCVRFMRADLDLSSHFTPSSAFAKIGLIKLSLMGC
jgi:hypothetical protein